MKMFFKLYVAKKLMSWDDTKKATNFKIMPPQKKSTLLTCDLVHPDAAHGPDGEGPDERVRILAVLDEGVDGHDGHLRLGLGVVHQVEVHQLLQLQVVSLGRRKSKCA